MSDTPTIACPLVVFPAIAIYFMSLRLLSLVHVFFINDLVPRRYIYLSRGSSVVAQDILYCLSIKIVAQHILSFSVD
jgi:hypothetical protein